MSSREQRRRRERDRHRQRAGGLYRGAVHSSRQPESARDRGVRLGRAAAADDRRRELSRVPGGDHGSGDDGQAARPGRAVRRAPAHRGGRARRAGDRARAAYTGSGSETPSTGRARSCWRWAPSTRSWASPARRSSRGRGVSYCATCDAAFFRDAHDGDRRRRRLGDGGGDIPVEVRQPRHDRAPPGRVQGIEDHARAGAGAGEHRAVDAIRVQRVRRRRARRAGTCRAGEHRDRRGARDTGVGHVHRGRPRAPVGPGARSDRRSTRTDT